MPASTLLALSGRLSLLLLFAWWSSAGLAEAACLPEEPVAPGELSVLQRSGDLQEELRGAPSASLERLMHELIEEHPLFRRARSEQRLSMVIADLHDPCAIEVAHLRPDWEIFTASLSKMALLLATVDQAYQSGSEASLQSLRESLIMMIRWSSNEDAVALYHRLGVEKVLESLQRYELHDPQLGGLMWAMGTDYRSPTGSDSSITGTARQIARYLLMMEQGRLVSPEGSRFIKGVLKDSSLAIFSLGIRRSYPGAVHYGKAGIYGPTVAEGLLIEEGETRYIVAILTQGLQYKDPAIPSFAVDLHRRMLERSAEESP